VSTLSGYHDRTVYSCSWNAEGDLLATAGADDKLCIFKKTESGSADSFISMGISEQKKSAHDMDINSVVFHPKENILATAGDDCVVKIWRVKDDI